MLNYQGIFATDFCIRVVVLILLLQYQPLLVFLLWFYSKKNGGDLVIAVAAISAMWLNQIICMAAHELFLMVLRIVSPWAHK